MVDAALGSILEQHDDQLGDEPLKHLWYDIPEAKFHFLSVEVELQLDQKTPWYDSKDTPESPRQAWNKHKRCQRKAGVINIESSDICSSLCSMNTRLISSPEKPQTLDSSMTNWWDVSSLHSVGRASNIAEGLQSVRVPLFLSKCAWWSSGEMGRHEEYSKGHMGL